MSTSRWCKWFLRFCVLVVCKLTRCMLPATELECVHTVYIHTRVLGHRTTLSMWKVPTGGEESGESSWLGAEKTRHAPKRGGLILHDMAQSTNWFTFSQVPSPQPVKCLFQHQASPLNKTLYLEVRSNRITSTALWICANISCQLLQPDVSHVAVWTTKVHGAHILPRLYVIWWFTDKKRSFCWSTLKIDSLWLDGGSWTGRLSLAGGCRRPRAGRMRVRGCQTVSVKVEDTERDDVVC